MAEDLSKICPPFFWCHNPRFATRVQPNMQALPYGRATEQVSVAAREQGLYHNATIHESLTETQGVNPL
jgi:hypothetical protein